MVMIQLKRVALLALICTGLGSGCMSPIKPAAENGNPQSVLTKASAPLDDYLNGKAMLQRGQALIALNSFNRALQQDPNNPELLNAKGGALYSLGHYEAAVEAFETATKLSPGAAHIFSNLGYSQVQLGNLELAAKNILAALTLEPDNVLAKSHWKSLMSTIGAARASYWMDRLASGGSPVIAETKPVTAQTARVNSDPQTPREVSVMSVLNLKYPDPAVSTAQIGSSSVAANPKDSQSASSLALQGAPTVQADSAGQSTLSGDSPVIVNLKYPALAEAKVDSNALAQQGKNNLLNGDSNLAMAAFKAALKVDPLHTAARLGVTEIIGIRENYQTSRDPNAKSGQAVISSGPNTVASSKPQTVARSENGPSPQFRSPRVLVLNGVGRIGLACSEAKAMASRGWKTQNCADHKHFGQKRTVIFYVKGREQAALRLRTELGQASSITLRKVNSLSRNAEVQVLIGHDWIPSKPLPPTRT
jgi:Flp pilus assembly protein TadD